MAEIARVTRSPRRQRSVGSVAAACAAVAVLYCTCSRLAGSISVSTFLARPSLARSGHRLTRSGAAPRVLLRAAEDEVEGSAEGEEQEEPRAEIPGFVDFEPKREPVRYLPALDFSFPGEFEADPSGQTIPCFPLGGTVYVPDSTQVLNIFEPRYRQMYSDILMSGGRRFVVPQIEQDENTGEVKLAEVGVVFFLDDLREVSEQTNDQVKYVCQHSVVGRVRLRKVLNPKAFADRTTYLRVEAEDVIDEDIDEDLGPDEEATMRTARELDALQVKVGSEVRMSEKGLREANATRAGFWNLVTLWQDQVHGRARLCQQRFQRELQERIVSFLKEAGGDIPAQVTLGELPEEVQREVIALQDAFRDEIAPLVTAQTEGVQELVQCDSHKNRLALLRMLLETDRKRLEAKLALRSIFE